MAVGLALFAILGSIELEGPVLEVLLKIVATNKRELDTTDGLSRAVPELCVGGLFADVGRLGNA